MKCPFIKCVSLQENGYVDYDEFIQMMTQTQLKPLNAEEELRKTFKIFDIDGNGFISADEIKITMRHLGENLTDDEVNDMIKAADKNGDGKIDMNGMYFFFQKVKENILNRMTLKISFLILEFSGLLGGTGLLQSQSNK